MVTDSELKINVHSQKAQQLKTTPPKFRTGAQGGPRFDWSGNCPSPVLVLRSLSYLVCQV